MLEGSENVVNLQRMIVICVEAPPDVIYAVREKPPRKTMQFITTLLLTLVSFGAATLVGANEIGRAHV